MPVTDTQVLQALLSQPGASPEKIAKAMQTYGVSQDRLDSLLSSLDPSAGFATTVQTIHNHTTYNMTALHIMIYMYDCLTSLFTLEISPCNLHKY